MSFSGLLKLVCLLCVFAVAGKASAENKLYVEDFTISNYDVNKVAVMLDNTDEIAGLDFTLVLPEGIKLVGAPEPTERFAPSQIVDYNDVINIVDDKEEKAYKVIVVSLQPNRNFNGNEGPVLYLNLQAIPGALLRNSEGTLQLKDITLTNGTGSQGWTPANVNAKVTMLSGEFEISVPDTTYIVKPEVPVTVSVGIDNSAEISVSRLTSSFPKVSRSTKTLSNSPIVVLQASCRPSIPRRTA